MPLPVTYTNELGALTTSSNINAGSSIIICAEEDTVILPNGNFSVEKLGSCELAPIDPIDPIELPDAGIIPIGAGGGSTGGGGGGSFTEVISDFSQPGEGMGGQNTQFIRNQNFY